MTQRHIYQNLSEQLPYIVQVEQDSGFGGVVEGRIWCWTHAAREPIPEAWLEREAELYQRLDNEVRILRATLNRSPRRPEKLTGLISDYCEHRGWRKPDVSDRYEIFRLMRDAEANRPNLGDRKKEDA